MSTLDISILQKHPHLDCSVVLEVQPLAPLSMVSELPGSYYKTLKMPDKKMLCGLFENILGWHIDQADRKNIAKEVKKMRERWVKKHDKQKNTLFETFETVIPYTDYTKGSSYIPLLMDYFEVENINPIISKVVFYDDLWNKAFRRADAAKTHLGGTANVSYEIIARKNDILENGNETELNTLFKENLGKFPLFYSTPTVREFIAMDGKYEIAITVDTGLYTMLRAQILTNNICYLGNSEGWVDLKFKEL